MADGDVHVDEKFLLQIDLQNAFYLADRSQAFIEINKQFPEMSHWVESTYGIKGMLVFGRDLIYSCTGFMQGDPLASLLFAIAAFPVMASISAALPDLRANVWLHDHGTCIGRKEDALQVLQII